MMFVINLEVVMVKDLNLKVYKKLVWGVATVLIKVSKVSKV